MNIKRVYLNRGFYGGMHVDALGTTNTEFTIKTRKVGPVKDVINGLEAGDVDWAITRDYRIDDLSEETNIFIWPPEKRAPRYGEDTDEEVEVWTLGRVRHQR